MSKISNVSISGYKSIKAIKNLELNDINIFIGANGSGKSNIVSFFEMIGHMMTSSLGLYVAKNGFASSMLYHGQKVTNTIEAKLEFKSDTGLSNYYFRISHAAGDIFLFMEEKIFYKAHNKSDKGAFEKILGDGGYKESKLNEISTSNKTARVIKNFLAGIRVFHFHDTSPNAYIHQAGALENNAKILSDGGNLASFLYMLKTREPKYYNRILSYVKIIAPFIDDFVLEPEGNSILLKFKEVNSDLELGSFRLSDGTIRFICLATLLLQPKESMPRIIIIDEPELGLHPFAIDILSEMIKIASRNAQIFLTTQSERLINHFQPENIIVIDRKKDSDNRYYSDFKRLDSNSLKEWLKNYTISDLWNSNIIGGRP